ncbi:MAG: hypothetical protein ABEJ07_06075 [Candidatus Nanohaloarchaea archaeon]
MKTDFGGQRVYFEDRSGEPDYVYVNDDELLKAIGQAQFFFPDTEVHRSMSPSRDFEDFRRAQENLGLDEVIVVYQNDAYRESLESIYCQPEEFVDTSGERAGDVFSMFREDNPDGILSVLNGSNSEEKKDRALREVCQNYPVAYLGKVRDELVLGNGRQVRLDTLVNDLEGMK